MRSTRIFADNTPLPVLDPGQELSAAAVRTRRASAAIGTVGVAGSDTDGSGQAPSAATNAAPEPERGYQLSASHH